MQDTSIPYTVYIYIIYITVCKYKRFARVYQNIAMVRFSMDFHRHSSTAGFKPTPQNPLERNESDNHQQTSHIYVCILYVRYVPE